MVKMMPKWINKQLVLAWSVILFALFLALWLRPSSPSPVPANIKSQVNFKVPYPRGYSIDTNSWKYSQSSKTLTFDAKKSSYTVVFTEQKVPLEYQNDAAAYNRFIGSLRPSANFDSPLGTVSITNFVTAAGYQPTGPAGVLSTKGTLLIAHPSRNLSDEEWRDLFNSLKLGN